MAEYQDHCAVFAVGASKEAARLTFHGLFALQHRGQESTGISVSNGKDLNTYKNQGLVTHVYSDEIINSLSGDMAIGHNRYSTNGDANKIQPITSEHNLLALAHNGNLPITYKLDNFFEDKRQPFHRLNDSEKMHRAVEYFMLRGASLEEAIITAQPLFEGAYSCVFLTKNKIAALRDECGIRPLSIGATENGCVFSSETCALDTIGAEFVRDVRPAELASYDGYRLRSEQLQTPNPKTDIFEFVYFARPDSIINGVRVYQARFNLGMAMAKSADFKADLVLPVPETGIPMAEGFNSVTGIPFRMGFIKNRYIHRTFISPGQELRERGVRLKLNIIPEVIKDKVVVVVDDSLVRSTTMGQIVAELNRVGARKVIVAICSSPIRFPGFYGIDTPNQSELVAASLSVNQIRDKIRADELHYLTYQDMVESIGLPEEQLCTSDFSGVYPIPIGRLKEDIVYA